MPTAPLKTEKFEQIVYKVDPEARLLRAWTLKGGVSAQVTAVEVEFSDGHVSKIVVRQHGQFDLIHNPQIAMDEFKLLQLLQSEDLAAPLPIYVDESGEIFPTPYIVLHYIEGQTTFSPPNMDMFNYQLAEYISRVHRVDASKVDFLPYQAEYYAKNFKTRPEKVDDSLDEGKIRDVLETAWPLYQHNKNVLLHGDFWPGNILWDKGQIAAAIDWEDTNVGDPLGDISISRLEMLWAFGQEAMDNFTEQYKSLSDIDFTNLPYWDLCAALRPAFRIGDWAGNEVIEQRMREQHKVFVNQAFEKLGVH